MMTLESDVILNNQGRLNTREIQSSISIKNLERWDSIEYKKKSVHFQPQEVQTNSELEVTGVAGLEPKMVIMMSFVKDMARDF